MTERGLSQFSLAGFAVAVVTVGVGTAAGLALVPVAGSYLGMVLGGLVAGLAVEDRPVLEGGIAAVLATLGVLATGGAVGNGVAAGASALTAVAPLTLLASVVLSFAAGAFGAHFGDDLRHGLTEAAETPQSGPTSPGPVLTTDEASTRERESEQSATETGSEASDEAAETGSETGDPEGESENLELELE